MQFRKQELSCLDHCLSQTQTLEQTQEVSIPDGGAGVQRILGTWGQVIMRSKEWLSDSVRLTGGVLVWVLYEPEEGEGLRCLNSWIPFRMDWDLPGDSPEGMIRIRPLLRSADARAVSAGKVLIRVSIAALAECFCPHTAEIFTPQELPSDAELLRQHWPVRLLKEAGEKPFDLEEDLLLPDSVPGIRRLISWQLDTRVTDKKILGNKIVFRGTGNLHVVYESTDGYLRSWDFELPFSQYAELNLSHSPDAQGEITLAVTRLELECGEEGRLHLRAGLTGQYLVDDRQVLETVEDAFSPHRELSVTRETLSLPVMLDSRRETVTQQQNLPIVADTLADGVYYPDFPRQHREGDSVRLQQPTMVQILYYDGDGVLQSAYNRMEGDVSLRLDSQAQLTAVPQGAQLQMNPGMDTLGVRAEIPIQAMTFVRQSIPMVTALELGERRKSDPDRPTLILRRAGKDRLWDIARKSGSSVAAIRQANHLEADPEPGQMLLIPVV